MTDQDNPTAAQIVNIADPDQQMSQPNRD